MKTLFFSILFVLLSSIGYSQTIDGYDVTNYDVTGMEYDSDNDVYFLEYFDGLFDWKMVEPNDKSVTFSKWNATGMNFYDINNFFVNEFGKEDSNNDYIPDFYRNDYSMLRIAIENDEAKIFRVWWTDKLTIILLWENKDYKETLQKETLIMGIFTSVSE